jgi:DNA-binding transcriptional ArsR family regulator
VSRVALDHDHPIDPDRVAVAREHALTADDGERVADALRLLADPVRVRIVSALAEADELCVGDLALALDVSDSSVSHALRLLRTAGVVRNRRDGRVIYYRLADPVAHRVLQLVENGDPGDHAAG